MDVAHFVEQNKKRIAGDEFYPVDSLLFRQILQTRVVLQRTGDLFDLLSAHEEVGVSLLHQGTISTALEHHEQSIRLYNPGAHGCLAYTVGFDRGVGAHSYAAQAHAYLGYLDRAFAASEAAVALAQRVEHPLSLAQAVFYAGVVHFERGEFDRTRERAAEVVGLAEQLGFPLFLGVGRVLRGWARVQSGDREAGLAETQQTIGEWAASGSGLGAPQFFAMLAASLRKVGRHNDALSALARGMARAEEQGQHFYDAELHRLRAEILLDMDGNGVEEVDALFNQALEIARRQEAKTFELRVATSLARLWQRQGKHGAARDLLAPVYEWFTEGSDTRDLKDAKAVLGQP